MLAQSQLNHIKTKYQHSNLARSGFFIFEENITNIREALKKKPPTNIFGILRVKNIKVSE